MQTVWNATISACLVGVLSAAAGCSGSSEGDNATTQPKADVVYQELEMIKTSLVQPDGSLRVLRLTLNVEIAAKDAEAAKKDIAVSWPNIQDKILQDLSVRKPEFVNHPKSMEAVLKKIQEILNANLDKPYVRAVLIKECFLQ